MCQVFLVQVKERRSGLETIAKNAGISIQHKTSEKHINYRFKCDFCDKIAKFELKPKSVIRLLRANTLSICHMPRRFSITMESHCSLKAAEHLFKYKGCYHHNANDRFGLKHD